MLSNCIKLLVDIEPFYFFKLSKDKHEFLLLEIALKENSEVEKSACIFEHEYAKVYEVIYNNDCIGYLLESAIPVLYSGAYVASTKAASKMTALDKIFKQGHLAVYCFDKGQFIAVSSKLSSTTESILEEQ